MGRGGGGGGGGGGGSGLGNAPGMHCHPAVQSCPAWQTWPGKQIAPMGGGSGLGIVPGEQA